MIEEGKKFHFDNRYWDTPRQFSQISAYQIGDLSCHRGFECGEHQQLCYEISYIVSGRGRFFTNGSGYDVQRGDLYISRPGEVHNLIADEADPFRFLYLAFWFNHEDGKPNPCVRIEQMLNLASNPVQRDMLGVEAPFQDLMKELYSAMEFSQQMVEHYMMQIIILTYRNFFAPSRRQYPSGEGGGSAKDIVYAVVSYLDNNLAGIDSISKMADALNYSYSRLSHLFREETGMTIQSYYNSKRMKSAALWIGQGELSVSEIAEKLNYQTIHSFSKAFKKEFGVSPAQYKQMSKGSHSAIRA